MLNILIGNKCNLKCTYCFQGLRRDDPLKDKDAIEIYAKFVAYIRKNNIRRISYWGGEPLAYWSRISEMHQYFLDAGLTFDFVKMMTNGTMMTEAIAKKLAEWKFYVATSYHYADDVTKPSHRVSPNFSAYNVIPPTHRSLVYTLSHQYHDLMKVIDDHLDIEKDYGEFCSYFGWIFATDTCNRDTWLTREDFSEMLDDIRELARLRMEDPDNPKNRHLLTSYISEFYQLTQKSGYTSARCFNEDHVSIDLNGRMYGCHHIRSHESALVDDAFSTKPTVNLEQLHKTQSRVRSDKCMTCRVSAWCRGSCYLNLEANIECEFRKEFGEILYNLCVHNSDTQNITRLYISTHFNE